MPRGSLARYLWGPWTWTCTSRLYAGDPPALLGPSSFVQGDGALLLLSDDQKSWPTFTRLLVVAQPPPVVFCSLLCIGLPPFLLRTTCHCCRHLSVLPPGAMGLAIFFTGAAPGYWSGLPLFMICLSAWFSVKYKNELNFFYVLSPKKVLRLLPRHV